MSISLLDLNEHGGLPILDHHYDEFIPFTVELIKVDLKVKKSPHKELRVFVSYILLYEEGQ